MKQQPDSFFREKLEQHYMPAPVSAWSRIEKEMPAVENNYFIWKVAAAILLLLVSIALLLPARITQQESSALSLADSPKQLPAQEKNNVADTQKESFPTMKVEEPTEKIISQSKTSDKTTSTAILNYAKETTPLLAEAMVIEQEEARVVTLTTTQAIEPSETIQETTTPAIPIIVLEEHNTIVIAAAEVNQKYLRPSHATQATPETENTSSFRKLIDKAAAFKNNSSGLAELRQKKNEMLAVNTDKIRNRNEKTERNN